MADMETLTEGMKLSELNSVQVAMLQNLLIRAGFDPGPVDGILGEKTRSAYSRFLTRNGHTLRGNAEPTITKLTSLLWDNSQPEYWNNITRGGEISMEATTGGRGNPLPAVPAAPINSGGGATAGLSTTSGGDESVAPPPDAATEESVRQRYPHLSYLLDIPEVRAVLLEATTRSWTEAELQGALSRTEWWQKTAASARVWDQKFYQDNATAMREWQQKTVELTNKTLQMGLTLDASEAEWVAGKVLREGWSEAELNRFLGQLLRNTGSAKPGQVTEQVSAIKALARTYLSTINDQEAFEYAVRIAEGTLSTAGLTSMFRDEAKNRFTWMAPQIDADVTPMALFGANRRAVAQLLEMDEEMIDLNDPKWSELTSPVLGDDGKPRSMNFYEAQRWARQRPEWRLTDNANQAASNMGLGLLRSMGVIK